MKHLTTFWLFNCVIWQDRMFKFACLGLNKDFCCTPLRETVSSGYNCLHKVKSLIGRIVTVDAAEYNLG